VSAFCISDGLLSSERYDAENDNDADCTIDAPAQQPTTYTTADASKPDKTFEIYVAEPVAQPGKTCPLPRLLISLILTFFFSVFHVVF
jgi:hypothetical protein